MTECSPIADQAPALFSLMADRIPGFVWSTDTDLRITAASGAGLAALNVQPSQFLGKTIFEYFQSNDDNLPGAVPHRRALRGEVVGRLAEGHPRRQHFAPLAALASDPAGSATGRFFRTGSCPKAPAQRMRVAAAISSALCLIGFLLRP